MITCPTETGPTVLDDYATVMAGVSFALLNTQVKSAPATTLMAGMVRTLATRVPMLPELPVTALLASVHEAEVIMKVAATLSVRVTAMPDVVTLMATGAAGVAVFAATVVMPAGALARLVCVNVKGPPTPPVVIFCTLTVGIFRLVNVHSTLFVAAVAAALSDTVPEPRFGVAVPVPSPLQLMAVTT